MRQITIAEIAKATEGKILFGNEEEKVKNVSIDSRKVEAGDLFIPIIGTVNDAHKFIPQVVEKGCTAVIVSREDAAPSEGCSVVLVEDTTKALQKLAAWYLKTLNLKTIAVTGSVGKTSTRDMVYAILNEKYKAGTTVGNLNSDFGVPLTIFSFDDSLEAAVLEVGMDQFGEIHRLVDIIRPDVGIITNVGISHIENLGSREGILQAKMEITDFFGAENALVINQSNDMLGAAEYSGEYKVIKVGEGEDNSYYVHHMEDFGEDGIAYVLTICGKDYPVRLQIPGGHNALNASLAIAGCMQMGISAEEAISGLSKIQLTGKRLTVKERDGIKIIDDTYNAAPDSMKSAINTLMNTKGERKIAILGGMNELGEESPKYHAEVGAYGAEKKVDLLITIGEKAEDIARGWRETGRTDSVKHFDTKDDFYREIDRLFKAGDVVVVKASRSMEFEQIVDRMMKEQE